MARLQDHAWRSSAKATLEGLECHQGHGFFMLCSEFQRGQVATSIIVTGSNVMSAMPWSLSFIDTRKT
jgi:hypothetical protein